MIGDADALHAGKIDHVQLVSLRPDATRFHVVFERLRNSREQEFMIGTVRLRAHGRLFPLGDAAVLGEQTRARDGEANQARGDQLIGFLAHGAIAGLDHDVVESMNAGFRRSGPEQGSAIAPETRTGHAQP